MNGRRLEVARGLARDLDLDVQFRQSRMQALDGLDRDAYDIAVSNNSLPYVTDQAERQAAITAAHDVLRPGGWLVLREANRLFPVDSFSGLPLVHWLPPKAARSTSARLRRRRSSVRVVTALGARRELRQAGFTDVRIVAPSRGRGARPVINRFHHVVGRKPDGSADR
jgi:SAM-dependent methyltransferase